MKKGYKEYILCISIGESKNEIYQTWENDDEVSRILYANTGIRWI
jgi:hypothetical protein